MSDAAGERLWIAEGRGLGERDRSARALMWDIGDWWNRGEAYGARAQIVTAVGWTGPTHGTARVAGTVAKRWNVLTRINTLTFYHHQIVAPLPDDQAIPLLQWCRDAPEPRTTQELRARIKQIGRATREAAMAEATRAASAALGAKLYGVILADPPWRFEPYSQVSGMDRSADNHYSTLTLDDIKALPVPAADNCVLFMWATVPMLPQALDVMQAWGFAYKSHCVWVKDGVGTGYWFRNQHEMLLVGTRGSVPAPAPGEQYASVIEAPRGRHSAKPPAFAEMIEELFPHTPAIELFARAPCLGWDTWGNEVAA
jgi:N6-adenosine-specific RNA methylase IME4